MFKMQLLSCIVLTLALITNSAPTSSSAKETQQQLEQLLLDLRMLLVRVKNYEPRRLSMMFTFKFNMPKKATELKHLQCLVEELKPLEDVLNVAPSKQNTRELISNINVTALELQGSKTPFMCEYDDKAATIEEFLNNWIAFCQRIISTLT